MERLVGHMVDSGILSAKEIIDAFMKVDRADFVPEDLEDEAYDDRPLPLLSGQTISQPSTVAFMLERLQPVKGDKVLDLGSGSGWTSALLAELVGSEGHVYGVEVLPELVDYSRARLARYSYEWAEIIPAGSELGLPKFAPFDRILVSAAAKELPQTLISQLDMESVMVIPVLSEIQVVTRLSDRVDVLRHAGFAFVPLVDKTSD